MNISELPSYRLESEEIEKIDSIINKYKNKKGQLIPILLEIQGVLGFLPLDSLKKVAGGLQIPEKEVYGVTTFYSYFSFIPRGKKVIRICLGTACFVKGGKTIAEIIEKELGIKPGQTTTDREYSFHINRCLGACGKAPLIVVNDKIYQNVEPERVMEIIYNHGK